MGGAYRKLRLGSPGVRIDQDDQGRIFMRSTDLDKGSINQRAVLNARSALVEELYAEPPSERVILRDRERAT